MDERSILDHQFVTAAYVVTWVLQLGYLAYLGIKWRAEKRKSPSGNRR
jgi:threonine/homoserine/homoserine lactone efflux protein